MYRALFPLSLEKTRFLMGTIYECLRKKLNLTSLLTSLRAYELMGFYHSCRQFDYSTFKLANYTD